MSSDTRTQSAQLVAGHATLSDIVEQLTRFDGPPDQFLLALLAAQCRISGAACAALLRESAPNKTDVLALFPPLPQGATAPAWLATAVELAGPAFTSGQTVVRSLRAPDDMYGQPSTRHLVMVPIRGAATVRGLNVLFVETDQPAVLAAARERLELTVSWLTLYEMRLTVQHRQGDLARLRIAMETLVAVNEQDRFAGSAMTLCNEIASRWRADRVGLGLLSGRYVKLMALSHTEKFSRKQKLVQDIEAAMEECLDQNVEIVHPAGEQATYVSRAAAELSQRHGPAALVLMPLRHAGEPTAVLMVQRPVDQPISLEELEALRLACDLCSPRVAVLHEHDRWFGAKLAAGTRKLAAGIVGSKHTWAKLAAIGVLAAVVFVTFVNGAYEAGAPFVLDASERQVLCAPFDQGQIEQVLVQPGDNVNAGDKLMVLRTDHLVPQLLEAESQQKEFEGKAREAQAHNDTAKQQIAEAQAAQAAAKVKDFRLKIEEATIRSPIRGQVITGDWIHKKDNVFKFGEKIFEVAPVDSLWAELSVPQDEIAEVSIGLKGEMASQAYPDQRVPFQVEWISPMAEPTAGAQSPQNVFKVRVRLLARQPWMKVGMEGEAKVKLGEQPYIRLWSRKLVNWVRMKLWI